MDNYNEKAYQAQGQAQRETEIPQLLRELEKRIAGILAASSSLEGRLSGVMRAEPPSNPTTAALHPAPQTQIGGMLSEALSRLSGHASTLQSILDRLEV